MTSAPPDCSRVLEAIRSGARFLRMREGLGALCVGPKVLRLVMSGEAWGVDPDAGSLLEMGTFEVLCEWADGEGPFTVMIGRQHFVLGLLPDNVAGVPVARVVVLRAVAAPPNPDAAELPVVSRD